VRQKLVVRTGLRMTGRPALAYYISNWGNNSFCNIAFPGQFAADQKEENHDRREGFKEVVDFDVASTPKGGVCVL
jgi:hypothetical protein